MIKVRDAQHLCALLGQLDVLHTFEDTFVGGFAEVPGGRGRVVCASKQHADGSLGGRSMWLHGDERQWIAGLWTPRYYLLPKGSDVVAFVTDALSRSGTGPLRVMPAELVDRYGLREIEGD